MRGWLTGQAKDVFRIIDNSAEANELVLPMKIIHRRGHNCAPVSPDIRVDDDSPI
jgi:hypothetical protein